jgi:hypothetical protein
VKGFSAMTKTSFADSGALMSPRTAKYVEALIREGDNFDCQQWLQQVREEEAQAKQILTVIDPRDVVAAPANHPVNTSDSRDARPSLSPVMISKLARNPRALRRPHRQAKANTTKARLRRWLERISNAWNDFQASRARDAVYEYLNAVFAIVEHYRTRRRTNKLLRYAFEFADQPLDKNADPFTAVIRCTCDDHVDSKTISKWARALRYVAHCKVSGTPVKAFMKESGGVNACATRYAKLKRRRNRHN